MRPAVSCCAHTYMLTLYGIHDQPENNLLYSKCHIDHIVQEGMSLQCCWATVYMCSITSRSPTARTQQHGIALTLMNAFAFCSGR